MNIVEFLRGLRICAHNAQFDIVDHLAQVGDHTREDGFVPRITVSVVSGDKKFRCHSDLFASELARPTPSRSAHTSPIDPPLLT